MYTGELPRARPGLGEVRALQRGVIEGRGFSHHLKSLTLSLTQEKPEEVQVVDKTI